MSQRHPLAIVAGAATMLAAFPLTTVFSSFTWIFYTAIAVIVVVGTAMLVRTARGPVWVQVLAMMASLLLYVTFAFPSGEEIARFIPTSGTFDHFNELLGLAGVQIREEAVPVPDLEGLLLLTTVGVGLVAVLVDLAAVGIRRPALAGLPMLAIYSVPVAVLPDGLSILPFGFAAAGFLWLLVADSVDRVRRFGRRFTGEGRDVDLWEPSPLSSAGRRLGVVGVVIAMLLPLAVPGMTSGLIDRFGSGFGPGDGGGGTGPTGSSVNLNALLKDNLSRKEQFEMVRVSTNETTPFYLRFGIADQITKEGFASRPPAAGSALSRGFGDIAPPTGAGVVSQRYKAEVDAVNFDMNLVPTYQHVTSATGLDNSWLYDSSTEQIFTRRPNTTATGKKFSIDYVRTTYTPAALRTAATLPNTDGAGRELATVPAIPQITSLVAGLVKDKTNQYDRVLAIYNHFGTQNGFQYSFDAPAGTSGNPIVDFLTIKQGFCVQYAAAMAWLVRAAGYPARVAFGFTKGSGPTNGVYSLTNLNLHAWTEVFFSGFGWVPFDPTPAGSVSGAVQTAWAPDSANPGPTGTDEGPDVDTSKAPGPAVTTSAGAGGPTDTDPTPDASVTPVNTWWLVSAAVVVAALFLFFAPALRRRALRRNRRSTSGPLIVLQRDGEDPTRSTPAEVHDPAAVASARRDAHAAWAELLDTMVDFSVPVDDSETPRATAARLAGLPALAPTAQTSAETLARAEERARYARAPLRPEGLNEALIRTRAALAAQATRRQRLSAMLLPQSVVQRWRYGWVMWLSGTVRRAGRVRDAMVSLSPRRLLTKPTR
jgi:transglutaminase-like putative cysteine protease/uncharacterized membrane protein YhaH (DUF805 family)